MKLGKDKLLPKAIKIEVTVLVFEIRRVEDH